MTTGQLWVLIGLGVFHGINPGMGWLAAVSRGLQERRRSAVLGALPAIAVGHAASVALVALVITVSGSVLAAQWFAIVGGALVCAVGLWLLLRPAHFHWRDVRLSLWQLGAWSFLMSSLHGAGLMLLPVLAGRLAEGPGVHGGPGHSHGAVVLAAAPDQGAEPSGPGLDLLDATLLGLFATGVHTVAMFAAAGVAALVVHDFFAVQVLRRLSWATLDRIWAFTLLGGGAVVLWGAA
ncbi:cell wall anchor protein [Nocardiopsis ansamitocini]|uniref:Cell wall anchor protein n=1 Tax=Nocardiopsis ansamitocini TaxID=1670832 RepID=A0A9W6UH05_9ACTN|nr:cell wall anchor protein [Nocardiopsis ansamitocini]GLU45828.1 hypothetical protein Nans01_01790 [Nocardiopsis ansamitocini]